MACTNAADRKLVRIICMGHIVDVANGLNFAHLANSVRGSKVVDAVADPATLRNTGL